MTSTLVPVFDETTKIGRFTDTTDYSAFNLLTSGAKGLGTVYFNGDIVFQKLTVGDPLINLASGATYFEFPLQLDSTGALAQGVYTINYFVRMAITGGQFLSSGTTDILIGDGGAEYADFLVAGNTLTLDGVSDTDVVIATVDALISGNPSYTLTETEDFSLYDSYSFDVTNPTFTGSYSYSACSQVSAVLEFTYDCDYGNNGTWAWSNATNLTNDTLVSLSGTLSFPSWAAQTPIEITALPYSNNMLYTGVYSANVSLVLRQTQTDGLIIQYTATYIAEKKVTCAGSLCGINPCLQKLLDAHVAALKANKVSPYQAYVDTVTVQYVIAQNYKDCGEYDNYKAALALIKAAIDASGCECACCDDNDFFLVQNTSVETQNQIEIILEQLNILQTVTYDKILFDSPVMFVDDPSYYPLAVEIYRTFDELSAITIPKEYFDTEPNGYSKKFVMLEITSFSTNNSSLFVDDVNGERLYAGTVPTGDNNAITQRHRIKLSTATLSGVVLGIISGESFQVDNDSPSTGAIDGYYQTNYGNDYWVLADDLVISITMGADNTDSAITECRITAYGYA